jgi:glycosyltransferase involved in cell wall biosynthesis
MSLTVSIIIPTYNGLKFIEKTIESCLKQSHKDLEIIVIDDGSTDGTRDLLLAYKEQVKLVFNKENLGIVKNINQAVNMINSDYFIFLGHDDLLAENHVDIMVSEFESDVVAVHCNSMLINKHGEETGFACDNSKQLTKTSKALFELSLNNFISSCGLLCKTSVFKMVNGWDEAFLHYGEWLYYIRALEHGKIKYTTKTHAFYRRHDTNITNTFKNKDVVKKLSEYYNTCRQLAHKKNNNTALESLKYLIGNVKLTIRRIRF